MSNTQPEQLPGQFPTKEEAREIVNELLCLSGVHDPKASCEILDEPFNLVAPSELEGYAKQIPCYVAIAKGTGLVLLFACTGPYGVYTRHRAKLNDSGKQKLVHLS